VNVTTILEEDSTPTPSAQTASSPIVLLLHLLGRAWLRVESISRTDLLIGLGLLGLLARVVLAIRSIGSNDIMTWAVFGYSIRTSGIGYVYDTIPLFNHPPLMGWMAALAHEISTGLHLRFDILFKLPAIAAECVGGLLIYRTWRSQKGPAYAALVFCLFCWNPVSMFVSAYHGNTDCLCAMLILLSALLVDRGRPFLGGLALAGSINVKLIGLVMIPVLLSSVRGWRNAGRFLGALSLGVIPFLPFVLFHWATFRSHVIGYRPISNYWGITQFLTGLQQTPRWASVGPRLVSNYTNLGVRLILVAPILLALANWNWTTRQRRWSARQMAAIVYSLFLVLTPGFGIQYTVYPVLVLFAASPARAVAYALAGGAYVVLVYFFLWTGTFPAFSDFNAAYPIAPQGLGYIAWATLAHAAIHLSFHRPRVRLAV
jgi:uncharacterized membrane protein YidH (DUF202 family)